MLFFLFFACALSAKLKAQRYLSTSRTINVYKVLDVSLGNTSSVFDFSALTDYDNGIFKLGMITATVKANVPWKLTLTVSNNILSPQITATPMPASVIGIKASTTGTYTNVQNNTPFSVQNNRGLYVVPFDLRALPAFQYQTQEYIGDFYFTISDQ
ncbi:hypothetical protein [Pedobacter gandavensis]|uniref:DUF4402 domain-containing protein n=1 Tax=Pedobacter gandavensis TaxID=2679963 RepID=A0ABR6EXA6_9SPHI|nr:hypothetical protein [Pedobacter gandavensis]MBB2149874.1 hypothetical protein [Pedobacter gandavensis]